MFIYKQAKEEDEETGDNLSDVNVDISQPHTTMELHVMRNPDLDTTVCGVCQHPFEDGDECGIIKDKTVLKPAHRECPK